MGIEVVANDIEPNLGERARAHGAGPTTLLDKLQAADVISLNCPLTRDTWHLLNHSSVALLARQPLPINTARGRLLDEAALTAALRDGRIKAVALDVFEEEPLPIDSPLRAFEQVVLGSHNSSNTVEAVTRVNELALANLLKGLRMAER